jgi:hypothetical protein
MSHTDKKESKKIPHIKGNPEGERLQSLTATSYMTKYLRISTHRSHLNFLIYEENFLFFFSSAFFKPDY